jgi:hypothetical protein
MFFAATLSRQTGGLAKYSNLANKYVTEFDEKWLRNGANDEPILGTADIQS